MTIEFQWRSWLACAVSIPILALAMSGCEFSSQRQPTPLADTTWKQILGAIESSQSKTNSGAVVKLWSQGRNVWSAKTERSSELRPLLAQAFHQLMNKQKGEGLVILCLPQELNSEREVKRGQERTRRGLLGARLGTGENLHWICPHELTAQNLDLDPLINQFAQSQLEQEDPLNFTSEKWAFQEFALRPGVGDNIEIASLLRGKQVVEPQAVSPQSTRQTAELMAHWLFNSVQPDGRMVYLYQPSEGLEGKGNNMIRQFMATVSLVRWSNAHPERKELEDKIQRNFAYNFKNFYREIDGVGVIEFEGSRKLGAMALAALAIHESKLRAQYSRQYQNLLLGILRMWQPDGSFRTHYQSAQNDNQNFYPGEALLLWAALLEEKYDQEVFGRFMLSFNYYYNVYHQRERNPAFVPWHTQAYYRVWKLTKDRRLEKAIFKMNDWLVTTMQQWDQGGVLADERGQFFSPVHPYGPPHASSTGVYLEGLIDAYRLAAAVKDKQRAKTYRIAMVRGIRSIQELQYKDDYDLFYVPNPQVVRGGVRTNNSENVIRVDNVQHALMGFINILATLSADQLKLEESSARPNLRWVARQGLSRGHEMLNSPQVSD